MIPLSPMSSTIMWGAAAAVMIVIGGVMIHIVQLLGVWWPVWVFFALAIGGAMGLWVGQNAATPGGILGPKLSKAPPEASPHW